jgi:hypothetical protein
MAITFPQSSAFDFDAMTVAFPVDVDSARYRVSVSVEALQDHFGLVTTTAVDAVTAFEANRFVIEDKARVHYSAGGTGDVLFKSADF